MMQDTYLALTPEQVAAVAAANGIVYAEDPTTRQRYTLIQQDPSTIHSDDYLREKVLEGLVELDRGEGIPWNVDAFKRRLADRLRQS
ncbi:hypothetical protein Pla108_01110 [Botrimarina colliarenosi]|uniref:Uncharacterized protein n=1 Tax=Botrimarina colliarenosi TaxID=2528001 RepID=A0A5C6AI72_9BACT|nr:hypothetical protein [Botrimarina colliarenosi]TWT99177.1 hypothetical protein Pla108_01110 [Botrimarina colliarenosi]